MADKKWGSLRKGEPHEAQFGKIYVGPYDITFKGQNNPPKLESKSEKRTDVVSRGRTYANGQYDDDGV